nr:T9SS type A sorting domain-containing protein [candidate division Zixibacteria bacterium]
TDVLASGRSTSKGEFVIKGTVVASGDPSNPVVFKSAAASPGTQDWYGVRVEPGASFKPTRAEFRHAYCGIDYRNSAADLVQNCLFQDNYMYGIRDSLNGNLVINRSRFDQAGAYGVYLDLANATVSEDTFYNVSMAINAYKSYGQIRNNVITTTTSGFFNAIFGFRAEGQVPPPGTQKAIFSNDSISGVFDEAAVIANGAVAIESCRIWTKLPAILPDPVPLSIGIQGLGTAAATVRNTTVKMYSSSTSTVPAIQVAGTPVLDLDAFCNFPCPDPPPMRSNRIYRAGTSAKAIQNLTASTVLARTNWWGTSSPTSSYFQGSVTWQPYMSSDPGPLGRVAASSEETVIPLQFSLGQNYPNPFNPTTTISFSLPIAEKVRLKIYNILGQEVRSLLDEDKPAGIHQVMWDGNDRNGLQVSSGLYFYKIQTPSYREVKRMIFLK